MYNHFTYQQSRKAFTMIELIMIIVIIGILATIALPKLAAVRADAKLAKDISRIAICINDAGMHYTARGTHLQAGDSKSCDEVICYTITYGSAGSNFTVETDLSAEDFCQDIDNLGGHLAKTYHFHGSRISI